MNETVPPRRDKCFLRSAFRSSDTSVRCVGRMRRKSGGHQLDERAVAESWSKLSTAHN